MEYKAAHVFRTERDQAGVKSEIQHPKGNIDFKITAEKIAACIPLLKGFLVLPLLSSDSLYVAINLERKLFSLTKK